MMPSIKLTRDQRVCDLVMAMLFARLRVNLRSVEARP